MLCYSFFGNVIALYGHQCLKRSVDLVHAQFLALWTIRQSVQYLYDIALATLQASVAQWVRLHVSAQELLCSIPAWCTLILLILVN